MSRPLALLAFLLLLAMPAAAQEASGGGGEAGAGDAGRADEGVVKAHGVAIRGEPKYPADFQHLDYVDVDAPKGGQLTLGGIGGFDSFNAFISRGDPVSPGVETLMTQPYDDPSVEYGLIAETIEYPEDRSWAIFNLRPEARWHDGEPITAEDVVWSFETLVEKGAPLYRYYYGSISKAEVLGPLRVKFTFNEAGNRELPVIIGQLPVLPKHYWETRDFEKTTLEVPLTSGPYRIVDFEPGRYVIQERVEDYWGKDLPINRGKYNFQRIRTDYYRDDTVVRQAVKAGAIDYRAENQAKAWAVDYDIPAVKDGRLIMERIDTSDPVGMQAFVMNSRRSPFDNRKVREALGYAFDFEWTNRNLFFSQYTRTDSYFENSEMAATGLPTGEELEILEPYRDQLWPEVFDEVFTVPKTDGNGWPRENLEKAFALLKEGGWEVRDMKLVEVETGRPMAFEILLYSPTFERIVLPFVRNLKRLGIDARVRLVDQAQYINRIRSRDFDIFISGWGQSDSPGNEQRDFWSSAAADVSASRNFVGIKSPVVDALIERLIYADTREDLVTATRALDRVLLWGHYVIPMYHIAADRIIYWNKFGRPAVTPERGVSIDTWWFDPTKAAALAARTAAAGDEAGEDAEAGGGKTLWIWLGFGLLVLLGLYAMRRGQRPAAS